MKKVLLCLALALLASCAPDKRDMMLEAYLKVNLPYFEDLTVEEWGETQDSMFNPRCVITDQVYMKEKALELTAQDAAMWDHPSWATLDSLTRLVQATEEDSIAAQYAEAVAALEHAAFCVGHPRKNCVGQTVRYRCNGLLEEDVVFYNREGRIANLHSLLRKDASTYREILKKFQETRSIAERDLETIKNRAK